MLGGLYGTSALRMLGTLGVTFSFLRRLTRPTTYLLTYTSNVTCHGSVEASFGQREKRTERKTNQGFETRTRGRNSNRRIEEITGREGEIVEEGNAREGGRKR